MNAKKANWLYLSTLLFEFFLVAVMIVLGDKIEVGILQSLVLSQMMILLPTVAFLIGTKTNPIKFIQCKRIKLGTAALVVVFTYLCLPLIVVVNAISMLFVENAVTDLTKSVMSLPAILVIFIIGIFGPMSEEFVFRGVIYHGYRRSGRIIGGMLLSGLLFGMTHLNFNQMSYAIVVGVLGALLIECTGSIVSSVIFHCVINLTNTIPIFLFPEQFSNSSRNLDKELEALNMTYTEVMCVSIGMYSMIAAVTFTLAVCLLYVIAMREGRVAHVKAIWQTRKEGTKERLWSVPLIIAIILSVAYMILDVILSKMSL